MTGPTAPTTMTNRTSLAFLGDVMLGRGVSRAFREKPPEYFFGDVLPILRGSDAVLANLEAPITTSDERWKRTWKLFHFRADPDTTRILTCGNIRFVCLANNHMMDYGASGVRDTLDHLNRVGIAHAGAGRSAAEAAAPTMLDLPGLKVGLMAATDNMPEFAAGPESAGTNHLRFGARSAGLDWVERSVAALRAQGAGLIVLSLHWGPNMRLRPNRKFRAFARGAIERGVDVIHGHSAHVFHGIERYRRGVIIYDAGNFIDDYWKFPFRQTFWSFVFSLDLQDGTPARMRLTPVHVHTSPLGLATGEVKFAIKQRMTKLCAPFGTPVIDTGDGLEIPLEP